MTKPLRLPVWAACWASLCAATLAWAQPLPSAQSAPNATPVYEAGWARLQTPTPTLPEGAAPSDSTTVALYYPTRAAARKLTMGAFNLEVAPGVLAVEQVKGLILLSHGMGGSELAHSSLAQALARKGYLVAALRHPGDNWQDRSLLEREPARYFEARPAQVSRVIDALLALPAWRDRIARDAQGLRIGALGHSAGGYTVLALAGGQPDLGQVRQHCQTEAAADPIFCGVARGAAQAPASTAPPPALRDARVRAVVAMAPTGAPLTADSLAAVSVPTRLYMAEQDRFLVPRFHAEWLARHLPSTALRRVPQAGHFAFMDKPNFAIPSPDGDVAADPPGFDRERFLQQAAEEISDFFDQHLR